MNRRRMALVLALVLGMTAALSAGDGLTARATTTQEQIDQAEQEKDELEGKLDDTNENLDDLKETHSSLKSELNNLNTQMTEVSDNLADLESQIDDKNAEIADTQAALDEAKATEEQQYADMVARVRKMYLQNDTSYLNAFLSAAASLTSFGNLLNMADRFEKIELYDQKQLELFKENRELIEQQEALLETELAELDDLKVSAEAEKNKVSGLISSTSNSISQYASDIDQAEAEALAYEEQIKAKEADLDVLYAKLAEEIAMSQAAAAGEWRDISEVSFAEGDRYLLANLIYCEAGGEPYAGQLAVGAVVINRVLSAKYPDTVTGVIYQNAQFSPVASGRLALALAANKATSSCYQAADEAMSGVTNVGTCVYFRTPIEGLTGINIGGHVFY